MSSTQDEIRALFENRSDAMRTKDLDRLLTYYSPDIIYFDIVPPLQYVGTAALRGRFAEWFDSFASEIGQDLRDLTIVENGDLAYASMLIRAAGTMKDGQSVVRWVRTTNGCQRSGERWLITHEHVSVPVDLKSGTVVRDLAP